MTEPTGRFWASTPFRIVLGVLAVIIVAAVVLVVHSRTSSGPPRSTATTTAPPVSMPQVVGLPRAYAQTLLRADGLTVSIVIVTDTHEPGVIVTQAPEAGSNIALGTHVRLTGAAGSAFPAIPNVVGLPDLQAKAKLKAAGFGSFTLKGENSAVARGLVISTSPAAGTVVPADTTVQLILSQGPPTYQKTATTTITNP